MSRQIAAALARWQRWAEPRYRQFRQSAHARAKRWQWADGEIIHPEPFRYERTLSLIGDHPVGGRRTKPPRPRPLKSKPARLNNTMRYGLDSAGEVCLVELYTRRDRRTGKMLAREEFFSPRSDGVYGAIFNDDPVKNLCAVSRQRFKRGRIVAYEVLGAALTIENYAYDENQKLARIDWRLYPRAGGKCLARRRWLVSAKGSPVEVQPK